MSRIYTSKANPLRFVWENRTKPASYNDFTFDDMFCTETLGEWEEQVYYEQKWQTSDAIKLQFIADFAGIVLKLIDEDGNEAETLNMSQKQADDNNPGFHIYEADMSLASIPPGNYRMRGILGADGDTMLSEPLCIQVKHNGTVYIEYFNSVRKGDMIFEKGFRPAIRVEARFGHQDFGSKDAMWEDQPLNMSIIDSKQFDIHSLHFGNEFGLPDWMFSKLNIIFGMDNVRINGKQFTKAEENQKFEFNEIEGYLLRGAVYNLRESINRSSNIIDTTVNTENKVYVLVPTHTDFFGDTENQGSNQILLLNYE